MVDMYQVMMHQFIIHHLPLMTTLGGGQIECTYLHERS